MIHSKDSIRNHCVNVIQEKIDLLNHELEEIRDSAENEDKNSSGDKFETGLAMLHQQKEKLMVQLSEFLEMKNTLDQIDVTKTHESVGLGSLVVSPDATFFFAVHLGKVMIENDSIFVISLQSPIAKMLLNKKQNETFVFKGKKTSITELT